MNRHDYLTAVSRSQPKAQRRKAWQNLARRRRRCVRLIEELGLRTQRIESLIGTVEKFSDRVDELVIKIGEMRTARKPMSERQPLMDELRNILVTCQESPSSLRNRVKNLRSVFSEDQQAKRELSEGNLRLVDSIAKKSALNH